MSATRAEVYVAIDSEREYQDAQAGNAARHVGVEGRGTMHPAEFILYAEKCLNDAREACYRGTSGAQDCLPFLRKVAGLAVACMELHGAPHRS